jgi:hypothetical protein
MGQCSENPVQHFIKALSNIFREKAKNEIAVLLQQDILVPVATVRFDAGKMLFPVQLNSYARVPA